MKPLTVKKQLAGIAGLMLVMGLSSAALAQSFEGHPGTQPRPGPSEQTHPYFLPDGSPDLDRTFVRTPEGQFPAQDPFAEPPGSNFLMTVYENVRSFDGNELPNTLPSTPDGAYNLHDGPVLTQAINKTNPTQDLDSVIDALEKAAATNGKLDADLVQFGIDILEGNPIADRAYSGIPMLHYKGPEKVKVVEPVYDDAGNVIGGNIDVEMFYWDQHIESDTAFVDPSAVQDVPWTITYNVNILAGGIEDFSPMVMNFDDPVRDENGNPVGQFGPFTASMDQSYFPMLQEGTRYTVKIKQTYGRHYNLTYIWGWRIHPPRVQVIENALKSAGGMLLPDHERSVFGPEPTASEENKLAAIAMIGDLSPAKRMWNTLRELNAATGKVKKKELAVKAAELRAAYLDWLDRTKLPSGVVADPDSTLTLLYVNNTIYGSRQGITGTGVTGDDSGQGPAAFKGICNGCAHDWNIRPYNYKVTLYNGDHFPHGYMNVDFGGSRGWENHFQYTDPTTALDVHPHTAQTTITGDRTDIVNGQVVVSEGNVIVDDVLLDTTPNQGKADLAIDLSTGLRVTSNDKIFPMNTGGTEEFLKESPRDPDLNASLQLGSGCFFTFGRNHAWPNAGGPWGAIMVPPVAEDGTPGFHQVEIEYNFEPSTRLSIYQFDPLHHDVAVYSLH